MKRRFAILILAALSALLVVFASGCFSTFSTWWEQQNCKHKYNDGVVTVDATCAEEGERVYTCSKCGKEKKEAIATLPHTQFTIQGQAATCLESGYTDYVICTTCKEIVVEKREIPALGHLETVVKGYAETCLSDGLTNGKKCLRCEKELIGQQVIPCKGHSVVTVAAKAPTCTEAGLTSGTACKDCGKIYTAQETVAATGHTFGTNGVCQKCGIFESAEACFALMSNKTSTDVTATSTKFEKGYYRFYVDISQAGYWGFGASITFDENFKPKAHRVSNGGSGIQFIGFSYEDTMGIAEGQIFVSVLVFNQGDSVSESLYLSIDNAYEIKFNQDQGYVDFYFYDNEWDIYTTDGTLVGTLELLTNEGNGGIEQSATVTKIERFI